MTRDSLSYSIGRTETVGADLFDIDADGTATALPELPPIKSETAFEGRAIVGVPTTNGGSSSQVCLAVESSVAGGSNLFQALISCEKS